MPLALASVDYAVIAFSLLAMIGVGVYFSREQRTTGDFFLAGRAMGWFPIGLSLMATILTASLYSDLPGEAYYVGYKMLLLPCAVWLTLPLLFYVVLPLYHRLGIFSIYEYLEMRFDATTRLASSVLFIIWRLLWLGGVLYAPCKVLVVATGLQVDTWWLLLVLGLVSTLYTFLGGMRAVIWTDVIQSLVMAGGLLVVIASIWYQLDGGAVRVADVTRQFDRAALVDPTVALSEKWSVWGILPHFLLAFLSFYVADQITAQRFLTAKSLAVAKRSFLINCLGVSIMVPALMYVGTSLLAFYHDHPEELLPIWVANVDHQNGRSIEDASGQPLIGWQVDAISPDNVQQLVDQRRLLRPNTGVPFTDVDGLVIAEDGVPRIDVQRLAMRVPRSESRGRGEVILNQQAKDELLPHFISCQLSYGLAGFVLSALLAASMSSMDSGLNSISTLLITDFHRRLGIGRHWLARRVNKPVEALSEVDELRIGRLLVLIIGLFATGGALLIAQVNDIFTVLIAMANTFGGPLLAVFLLGMFSRRATAKGALWTLGGGTLFTLWLMLASSYKACSWLWFGDFELNGIWPLTMGVVFSLLLGSLVSLIAGVRKSNEQLRGLVVGCGSLGVREPEEASIAIPDDFGIGHQDGIGQQDDNGDQEDNGDV